MSNKLENLQVPSYSLVGCIGAGLSAIALGASLKRWYGIDDIRIFERQAAAGGTWYNNSYPGCACDVPSALYSFSFALNPNWTRFTPPYREIRQYHEDVVKTYGLAEKMTLRTEVYRCVWREDVSRWLLYCRNVDTGHEFTHECSVLFGATGVLTAPQPCTIAGVESFKGNLFHSSEWNHDVSLEDKNVVLLGNGCSATQIVPAISKQTKSLTQIIRSQHWLFPPTNLQYPAVLKWIFRNVPLAMRLHRFHLFNAMEAQFKMFRMTDGAQTMRDNIQVTAEEYMRKTAPEEYHDILIPNFEIGCKRRVFDNGYLKALHDENVTLTNADVSEITPDGIKTSDGFVPADVIVLATGFRTNSFANDIDIYGRDGQSLDEHWAEADGPGAYNGTAMNGFPNFFLILGPNTATGHTSTLLAVENTINLALRLLKPVLHGDASSVEIKQEAEERYINDVQTAVQGTVFNSGCKSWYVNDKGWNAMTYPWTQANFWYRSLFPTWSDWMVKGRRKKSRFQLKVAALLGVLLCGNIYLAGVQNPKIRSHMTYLRNLVISYSGKIQLW